MSQPFRTDDGPYHRKVSHLKNKKSQQKYQLCIIVNTFNGLFLYGDGKA